MKEDYLDYARMLDQALLGVVKTCLKQVANAGLFGEHYFYITLKTSARGVVIPDFLRRQYPDALTIILQHEFSNLSVSDHEFGVSLSFNNHMYHIIIPFHSLMAFTDPSVNFSLTFTPQDTLVSVPDDEPELTLKDNDSNIIPLSDFFKKPHEPGPDEAA
ncbi:MAG: ClpXP protease specificity-enhancing factor SspB [Rickettsiales bacterium]|jgi:hypothetical protein|nr:ClpXP protease specificity-enhancing factor SspB [Rickettsiales bacterium]